eukprot:TRINITY_DN13696_c0_g1_i1.p1 TRINITY_DN13696_c0_g1~~TRINITY_DN13696_c0_g1_i1.p1  ORF type:complete len:115 (+),score=20.13 TRINITY_DN13696_c0_g1_i1:46-390(+)
MPSVPDKSVIDICRQKGYEMSSCLNQWLVSQQHPGREDHSNKVDLSDNTSLITAIFTVSMLVYVVLVVILVVKQFRGLDTAQEDNKLVLVSNQQGETDIQTVRRVREESKGVFI